MSQFHCFFKCSKIGQLKRRRAALVEKAEAQRQNLGVIYHQIEHPLHWMDYGFSLGRLLKKSPLTLPILIPLFLKFFGRRSEIIEKVGKWPMRVFQLWGTLKQFRNYFSRQ